MLYNVPIGFPCIRYRNCPFSLSLVSSEQSSSVDIFFFSTDIPGVEDTERDGVPMTAKSQDHYSSENATFYLYVHIFYSLSTELSLSLRMGQFHSQYVAFSHCPILI